MARFGASGQADGISDSDSLIALFLLIECSARDVACAHFDENAVRPKFNTLNIPN